MSAQPPHDEGDPDVSPTPDPETTLERSDDEETVAATPLAAEPEEESSLEHAEEEIIFVPALTKRRSPKYGRFGVIGGLLGLVVALVLAQTGTIAADQNYTRIDLSIILVGLLVPLGILVSMTLALLLDRSRAASRK